MLDDLRYLDGDEMSAPFISLIGSGARKKGVVKATIKCFNCGRKGHTKAQCPSKPMHALGEANEEGSASEGRPAQEPDGEVVVIKDAPYNDLLERIRVLEDAVISLAARLPPLPRLLRLAEHLPWD